MSDLPAPAQPGRRLEGMSAATWRTSVRSRYMRSAMTSVYLLDRTPDLAALRLRLERVTRLAPVLRSRIVESPVGLGQPRLVVDPDYDLDVHVAHYALPAPGSWEQLLRHVRRASITDLDRDRALWRATLIEGLADGRAAVVLVVHHAIADGQGLVQIVSGLFDASPDAQPADALPPAPEPGSVARAPVLLGGIGETVASVARRTLAVPKAATKLLGSPVRTSSDWARMARSARRVARVHAEPLSPLLAGRGSTYTPRTLDVPFPALKAAASTYGGTINDVFLAAVVAGLRRYHEANEAAPGRLRVNVPVSYRTEQSRSADNAVSIARIELDAAEPDAAARVAEAHAAVEQAVAEPFLPRMDLVAEASRVLPVEVAVAMSRGSDLTASNVPGVPVPVWLAGARVERVYPVMATLGAAANITLVSYARRWCSIGVCVDDLAVDQPDLFVRCLGEGFAEMGIELPASPYDPLAG